MSYSNGYHSETGNAWGTNSSEAQGLNNGYEPPQDGGGGSWGANPMGAEVNPDSSLGEFADNGNGKGGYGGWDPTNGGFEPDGWNAPSSSVMGAGETPYQTDLYSDGYRENIYQVNHWDTPYNETSANPDPDPGHA